MKDTAEFCCLLEVDPDDFIKAGRENIHNFALLLVMGPLLNGTNLFTPFNTILGCGIKFLVVLFSLNYTVCIFSVPLELL